MMSAADSLVSTLERIGSDKLQGSKSGGAGLTKKHPNFVLFTFS
jgi:hypothetical protein